MTDLPEPQVFDGVVLNKSGLYTATVNGYTAIQMREYRNQALEDAVTEIERHADLHIEYIVAAIRALKEHTQQVINDPAEIRRVFEIDEADYPPPDSGFAKL